ncbi:MAG TPA: energy-coupling factor transporter transmembrane component T [Herpetosiphonaceae bacterium]
MIALYQPRASAVHRLHPLTKLTISFGLIALALGVAVDWAPLALFVLVLIPLSVAARVARPFLGTSLRLLLPFALSLFVIQSLFFPEGSTVIARLGPLAVKAEGVRFAFAATVRILLITGALLLTLLTTHPGVLMSALAQKGLPPNLAYVIVTTLQIVPQMRERANLIVDAQRARGLETQGSLLRRTRALLPLLGPLVLGALLDVEERTLALEARAFSATTPKTSLFELPDPLYERLLRWAILLAILAVVGLRLAEALR